MTAKITAFLIVLIIIGALVYPTRASELPYTVSLPIVIGGGEGNYPEFCKPPNTWYSDNGYWMCLAPPVTPIPTAILNPVITPIPTIELDPIEDNADFTGCVLQDSADWSYLPDGNKPIQWAVTHRVNNRNQDSCGMSVTVEGAEYSVIRGYKEEGIKCWTEVCIENKAYLSDDGLTVTWISYANALDGFYLINGSLYNQP